MKSMKRLLLTTAIMCIGSLTLADSIIGDYKTITLDGSLSDWDSGDTMYPDSQIGDGTPLNTSYSDIYVANDGDYLYVALSFKGAGGGPVTNLWNNYLFMDVDMDSDTGYDGGWMTGGYDQQIIYGNSSYSRYGHNAADQTTWNFGWSNLIDYAYSDNVAEYRISRTGLGLTNDADQLRLEFQAAGGPVTVETWADQTESNVGTYTFGVIPEPSTVAMFAIGFMGLLQLRRRRISRG